MTDTIFFSSFNTKPSIYSKNSTQLYVTPYCEFNPLYTKHFYMLHHHILTNKVQQICQNQPSWLTFIEVKVFGSDCLNTKHYNMVHMHQEPVTCQYCDKQFQHSYSLSSHIYRKHERHMKMMPKMTEKENRNGNDISSFLRKHNICD